MTRAIAVALAFMAGAAVGASAMLWLGAEEPQVLETRFTVERHQRPPPSTILPPRLVGAVKLHRHGSQFHRELPQ
jgi:hypothetical protein